MAHTSRPILRMALGFVAALGLAILLMRALHTTTVGPGAQLLDVCVTVPPRAAAFSARLACARVDAVAMSRPFPFALTG